MPALRPNLLVIISDQHNPHVLGCAGDRTVRTPHLDRLAAAGVRFDATYCPAPLCVPSRMAFMTGLFPMDLEIWTNAGELASDVPTFAHQLGLAGYETILCGRMHFVGPDQHHGFERRLVGDVSGAMVGDGREMFEKVWLLAGCGQDYRSLLDAAVGPGQATYAVYDDAVTERACRFLHERRQGPDARPFCLVVGLLLPHNPYVCPRELFDEYMDRLTESPEPSTAAANEHPAVANLRRTRGVERITPEQARRARAAYCGLATCLDGSVGRVLAALQEGGLEESTAVLYTSDHGELAGEHGLWWKDSFYEGSVGVPMIWSWPGHFRAGLPVRAVTGLLDVAPTLLDLGQAGALPGCRGHSLAGVLESGTVPDDWPDTAWAETVAHGQRPACMLRCGAWKLNVYHGYEQPQLFNLREDPLEMRDRGTDNGCADIRRELCARVTAEWSGAWVERRLEQRERGRGIVRQWHKLLASRESERWERPRGCNVRG